MKTETFIHIETDFNLDRRLRELPHVCWKMISPETTGLHPMRFHPLIKGEFKKIRKSEVEIFCKLLKCTAKELMDPNHVFTDFRSEKQKLKDLNPSFVMA